MHVWTNLIKDGEFRFETSADKIYNFIIGFWFLLTKLITGKCQNLQACVSLTIQSFVLIKYIYKTRNKDNQSNVPQNDCPKQGSITQIFPSGKLTHKDVMKYLINLRCLKIISITITDSNY